MHARFRSLFFAVRFPVNYCQLPATTARPYSRHHPLHDGQVRLPDLRPHMARGAHHRGDRRYRRDFLREAFVDFDVLDSPYRGFILELAG
jgi:hypothetical protein